MRAVVVTLPEKGHYLPLIAPVRALEARGFEVVIAAQADIRPELAAHGLHRVALPPGAGPPADALRGQALAELLADPTALARWIRLLLVEAPAAGVAPMRAILRDVRPDVVAIDTMAYDGAIAAELEGVPWVGWATSLNPVIPEAFDSALIQTTRSLDDDRHALFAAHGLSASFRVSDVLSPRGTAVFTTEALVGPPPPQVELVGPSLRAPAQRSPPSGARPLVYASFGSQAWHQPDRYRAIAAATRELDVDVIIAMGDLAEPMAAELERDHLRCVRFAPQLELLGRASAMITHGGANSVMEALALGVPLVVAPICNDQPHNLRILERAGAGLGVDLSPLSPGTPRRPGALERADQALREALRAVLEDGPQRAATARLTASYASRSGAEGAASLAARHARSPSSLGGPL